MGFSKALREKIWVKALLAGPSGSGKTYSALRVATGLAGKCGSRIAYIDTENGRARYYAGEFDFDDQQLTAPFQPEDYIAAIDEAVKAGYKVLVIDGLSNEWDYCLDVHSKMPGNSYTNWAKITPRHDAFMEKILQSPIHIIATVRGKDEYVLEEKNGKQTPKKVGLGYKQRDAIEYNYTCTFNIAQDTHVADATKDNTHLFEGRYEPLKEADGEALYDWANAGEATAPVVPKAKTTEKKQTATAKKKEVLEKVVEKAVVEPEPPSAQTIETILGDIKNLVNKKIDSGVNREDIAAAIKGVCGFANYNKIVDTAMAIATFEAINAL